MQVPSGSAPNKLKSFSRTLKRWMSMPDGGRGGTESDNESAAEREVSLPSESVEKIDRRKSAGYCGVILWEKHC